MPYRSTNFLEKDKIKAAKWSADLLAGSLGDWCILDSETTGLCYPEIIDICILSKYRSPFINTRLRPKKTIESEAVHIHGFTNQMLHDEPNFKDVRDRIQEITKDKLVIIYNANFDRDALFNTACLHDLPRITFKADCAMNWYAQFYGEWHNYYGNYKWQKLSVRQHTAYSDCLAVHDLLKIMAAYYHQPKEQEKPPEKLFPPVQLACVWNPKFRLRLAKTNNANYWKKLFEFNISIPQFYWMRDNNLKKEDKIYGDWNP